MLGARLGSRCTVWGDVRGCFHGTELGPKERKEVSKRAARANRGSGTRAFPFLGLLGLGTPGGISPCAPGAFARRIKVEGPRLATAATGLPLHRPQVPEARRSSQPLFIEPLLAGTAKVLHDVGGSPRTRAVGAPRCPCKPSAPTGLGRRPGTKHSWG